MSESEEQEIRDYLLSKKLPIDILIEVQDHFISEINSLEREKDLQFPEAFQAVKENWRKDLTLYWNGGFDVNDSNDLMRKISKTILIENAFYSLKFAAFPLIIILICSSFLSSTQLQYFVSFLIMIIYGFPIFKIIKNFKKLWLPRKHGNYVLSLHQHNTFIVLSLLVIPSNVIQGIFRHPDYLQIFSSNKLQFWVYLLSYASLLILFFLAIFTIISQIKYLKQLETVKPFLKYLKSN